MKGKIILITSIIVIAMANNNLRAQAFEPASNSHNTVPSTWSGVGRVSCDITVYQFSSSQRNVFQVMAWDGTSPSWYYDVLNFYTGASQWSGTISLPHSDAVNPDICILAEKETGAPARVYVIVIYQRSGTAGIWTTHYRWDNTNHLFINYSPPGQSQVINVSAATITGMPQIDADRYDHFAAVWAEAASSQVHGLSGDMYGGHIQYDCFNNELDGVTYIPTPGGVVNPYPCLQPDICIGSDNLGGYYMHVVFKTNDGYLCTQDYRANDFCATGTTRNAYILDGNISGYDCNYPRIAAPRDFVTASSGLTQYGYGVVYEKKNNSSGITDACGIVNWCTYSNPTLTCAFGNVQTYTNGSAVFQSPYSANKLPKISAAGSVTRPVIAYDSYTGTYNPTVNANGNSIVVGFNYDDGSNPKKPAAFYANVGTGQPHAVVGTSYSTIFQEVSNNTSDNQSLLSMSGESDETDPGSSSQNYKNMLYCWYDLNTREVLYKTVQNVSHFRMASSGSFNFSVYPNPVADYITVSGIDSHSAYEVFISDLKGQVIYHTAAGGNNVNENLNQAIGGLANGMYLMQLKNTSGENGFVKLNIIH